MKHFAGFAALATFAVLGIPGLASASNTVTCIAPPLIATSPTTSAQLGWSLSANGAWLAAGAFQDNAKAGSVALYKDPGTKPDPHPDQEITAGDPHPGDQFGASVSISDPWLAVGAPAGDGRVQDSGVVYLFQRDGNVWTQQAKLEAGDAARGAQFGFSVSLAGSRLVVGAPGDSDRGSLAGSAYVFEMQGNSWNLTKELHADLGRPFDEFGFAVATAGDQLVIGAPFADDLTLFKNFGAVYVFDNPGVASNGWAQAAKLTADGGFRADNIQFGASLAMSEAQIVVGVPGDDLQNLTDSGSAYVFTGSGTTWSPKLLTPEDPGTGEQFGSAVLIDVDGSVVIGSRFDGQDGLKAGAAYLFQNNPGWTQINKYVRPAPGAAYGQSVARLNGQVFMGGYLDDVGVAVDAGSVAVCPPAGPPHPTPQPDLVCTKRGPPSVEAGDLVTYTIQVTNQGGAAATGVTLDDPTPDGLTLVRVSGAPQCTHPPCSLGTIGAGDSSNPVTVTFQVPDGCSAPGSIRNTATGQDDGTDSFHCTSSPTTVIRPPGGPSLSCSKQGPSTAQPGDIVTYEIAASNSGCEAAKNVMLSDPTPAGLSLVSVSGPCTQFPCNLGTIHPGETLPPVQATFNVDTTLDCSASQTVENTGTVNGAECMAQTRIVPPETDLALMFSAAPTVPTTCGTTFSFSLTASNLGTVIAKGTILDIIAVGATDLSAPGCVHVPGSSPHLTCSLPDLAPGQTQAITFSVQAPACGPNCGAVTINANVKSGNTCDRNPLNDSVSRVIPVTCSSGSIADLAITKTHEPEILAPGQAITYVLTVRNNGPSDVPGATVTDALPSNMLSPECASGNPLGCAISGNNLTIQLGPLAAGDEAIYRIEGQLPSQCAGTLTNTATVTPPPGITDPILSNNTATDTTTVPSPPGVSIHCMGVSDAFEGDYVTFTYVLSNGGSNAQGDNPGAELTDTLPAGLTLVTAIASSGTVTTAANTVSWNGSIPACGTVTIAVQVKVNVGTMGTTICNQGAVAFDANGDGINESNANATCCLTVLPPPPFVPTLSGTGLAALTILLACVAVLRLRRRSL